MIARRDLHVSVTARDDLSPTCFRLTASSAADLVAEPGQFGMLTCAEDCDPLLRRAFSFAGVARRSSETVIEFLLKEVGRGTGRLRRVRPGETLRLLAPLGHGFTLAAEASERLALVAGGIGLPPLLFAAERLAASGSPFDLFLGAATAAELLEVERCAAATAAVGGELVLATDDGSCGEGGLITAALARRLRAGRCWARVLACGPDAMLKALARLAQDAGLEAELSLEEPMACGLGVCLGCVIELADGRVVPSCQEGPVFPVARLAARWWT